MKKIILFAILALGLMACEKQLDIIPKGQTTLSTVKDLELLLNQPYGSLPITDISTICNAMLGVKEIPTVKIGTNTLEYAYLFWDESLDRKELTQSDTRYSNLYKYINCMNVVVEKMDGAEGDESRKATLMQRPVYSELISIGSWLMCMQSSMMLTQLLIREEFLM